MRKLLSRHCFTIIICLILTMGMFGCKQVSDLLPGKKQTAPSPQNPNKLNLPTPPVQKQLSSIKSITEAKTQVTDFSSLKDPFKPFIILEKTKRQGVLKKNKFGQALPILNFEVGQFKVTGIIIGLKETSAQIVDPEGKTYVVKNGMEIGRNDGVITKIGTNYIEVFENYIDDHGKRIKNTVRLILPKKE